jgi:soluble lytic murein transglycosylase-like protein
MRVRPAIAFAGLALLAPRAPAQSAAAPPPTRSTVADFVADAARRFVIPERWIYAVMRVESAGNPRAISPKGASGLMQIMPATWRYLRAKYGLGDDIYDPHDNIIAGAVYLRELYDRYGVPGMFAAYNAGPVRYENHLARGVALPGETVTYVRRLAPSAAAEEGHGSPAVSRDPRAWTRAALFSGAPRDLGPPSGPATSSPVEPGVLPPRLGAAPRVASDLFIPLSGQSRR